MADGGTGNRLYYGDNLAVLREHVATGSVDLIYLDPPFNSNAGYNVLFRDPTGARSASQIEAFDDTWEWGEAAERAFDEVIGSGNSDAAEVLRAVRAFLKDNALMAYLAMMAVRLLELHRVLKPTGSLYLHCDTEASAYLKIVLDSIFGTNRYLNEITWKRTSAHNDPQKYGRVQDRIFFYSKSKVKTFNAMGGSTSPQQLARYDGEDERGKYKAENLTAPKFSPTRTIDWRGVNPGPNRQWRFGVDELERLYAEGLILLRRDGLPRKDGLKEYLASDEKTALQDLWTDIQRIGNTSKERLGYPTQKPLALMERIIGASSNPGDLVLDPFCGCGTTVHAAQKLGRRWVGIDVTHLAVGLIRRRLIDAFPAAAFEVLGVPKDLGGARALAAQDKHQFQLWALSLIEAQPYKGGRKGADGGVDGYLYFKPDGKLTEKAVVSVKGGGNVGVGMIRDLIATVEREGAKVGVFLTLEDPTSVMRREAAGAGFYKTAHGQFARIQVITIEDALAGTARPHLPWIDPSVFKRAKREKGAGDAGFGQGGLDV